MSESVDAWNAAAAGWERRSTLFREATETLSARLVELLDPEPGETILELAAGLGDTGFRAARRLEPGGRLLSTDAAPAMVDAARRRAAELGLAGAEFHVIDLMSIDLPDASVDGVLCRFGVMLVEDPAVAFGEIARVLHPGGRAAIAVWASPDANEWMTAVGRAALELELVERPDPRAPGPFRLADVGELRALIAASGLTLDQLEDVPVTWRAASLDEWWGTVVDMSPTMRALLPELTADGIAELRREAESRLASYVAADGLLTVPGVARAALAARPA